MSPQGYKNMDLESRDPIFNANLGQDENLIWTKKPRCSHSIRLLILVFRGRDEARNFASFLGHFEVETRPSRTSANHHTKAEPRNSLLSHFFIPDLPDGYNRYNIQISRPSRSRHFPAFPKTSENLKFCVRGSVEFWYNSSVSSTAITKFYVFFFLISSLSFYLILFYFSPTANSKSGHPGTKQTKLIKILKTIEND